MKAKQEDDQRYSERDDSHPVPSCVCSSAYLRFLPLLAVFSSSVVILFPFASSLTVSFGSANKSHPGMPAFSDDQNFPALQIDASINIPLEPGYVCEGSGCGRTKTYDASKHQHLLDAM